ncbi:hypothetical protein JCM3774_005545 [Rhodotorula dairenensis]
MGKLDFDVAPPADSRPVPVAANAADDEQPAQTKPMSNKEKRKESKKRKSREGEDGAAAPAALAVPAATGGGDVDDQGEPVLSHKEKRLAKKRKLAAEQAGQDPEAAAATAAKPTKPAASAPTTIGNTLVGNTPARSAHGVWVGNMNFATHPRELLAWFADRGLKDVTRINMPGGKRTHENNRGFAYLDFPSAAEVQIAVGLSEQHLDGRKLLIKDSSDFSGRPAAATAASTSTGPDSNIPNGSVRSVIATLDPSALERPHPNAHPASANGQGHTAEDAPSLNRTARKILSRQRNPAGPTLFLGNLGFETTSDDIRDMFDRNQRRASEWAPGGNPDAKKQAKKGKGKRTEGEANDEEGSAADAGSGSDDEENGSEAEAGGDESGSEGEGAEDGEEKADRKKKDDRKAKKDRGPLDLSKAKDAGIRKIRLGTFEDSGKCKGWAFVDFHLPAQATRALLNLHNHQLNGRKLNVEFASAEAVRRGNLGTRSAVKRGRSQREQEGDDDNDDNDDEQGGAKQQHRGPRRRTGHGHGEERHGGRAAAESSFGDVDVRALAIDAGSAASSTYGGPPRRRDFNAGGGGGRSGGGGPPPRRGGDHNNSREQALPGGKRAKPGAALAMAQRASEAIVQSTGRKTTFDS